MRAQLAFIVPLLFSATVSRGDRFEVVRENGAPKLYFRDGSGSHLLGELLTLPAGTKLYHWGSKEEASQIASQGNITQQQLDSRMDGGGGNQGGGFYVSVDPWDSKSYGPKLTVLELESDTSFVMTKLTHEVRGKSFLSYPEYQKALRAAGVQGSYYLPSRDASFETHTGHRWLNVVGFLAATKARAGHVGDLLGPNGFNTRTFSAHPDQSLKNALLLNSRYPLENNEWMEKNIPTLSKLILGKPLTSSERIEVGKVISITQAEDSSPIARRLKIEFHEKYKQILKEYFRFLVPDEAGNYPSVQSLATRQWLEIADRVGVDTSEIFSSSQIEKIAQSYPEIPRRLLKPSDSRCLPSVLRLIQGI